MTTQWAEQGQRVEIHATASSHAPGKTDGRFNVDLSVPEWDDSWTLRLYNLTAEQVTAMPLGVEVPLTIERGPLKTNSNGTERTGDSPFDFLWNYRGSAPLAGAPKAQAPAPPAPRASAPQAPPAPASAPTPPAAPAAASHVGAEARRRAALQAAVEMRVALVGDIKSIPLLEMAEEVMGVADIISRWMETGDWS